MSAFRAALVVDIRMHRLAWSAIVAGLLGSAMLWGSILGAPLARPASFDTAAPRVMTQTEHPIEFGPPE